MATPSVISKPSKWFSPSKNFNLISRLPHFPPKSKPSHPSSNVSGIDTDSTDIQRKNYITREEELLKVFRHFDRDNDGKISGEELSSYFHSIGEFMSHDDIQKVVNAFDINGDKLLEFDEFVRLVEGDDDDDDLRMAFEMFEVEKGGGKITAKGLQQMLLHRLGDAKSLEECAAMIRVFDLDGNGVLDFQEFHKMMT